MKTKVFFLLITSLLSMDVVWGQWDDPYLRPYIHIEDILLDIDAPSKVLPHIIIDSNGTTRFANATVYFTFLNYIDSTREIIISDFSVSDVWLNDSIGGGIFSDILYSEEWGVPPPEEISDFTRKVIINKIEEAFNNEKKRWFITLTSYFSLQDITECEWGCLCRGSLRCWIKF